MAELASIVICFPLVVLGKFVLKWVLKRVDVWIYESKLGEIKHCLPPADLGWAFIGNMLSFLRALKTVDPDFFIRTCITRGQKQEGAARNLLRHGISVWIDGPLDIAAKGDR